jgi:hypothetical protein
MEFGKPSASLDPICQGRVHDVRPSRPRQPWETFAVNLVIVVLLLFAAILGQLVLLGVLDLLNRS